MKQVQGYKTIFIAILSFVVYALGWDQLVSYVDPQVIAIAGAVAMAILRFLTTSPVFKK